MFQDPDGVMLGLFEEKRKPVRSDTPTDDGEVPPGAGRTAPWWRHAAFVLVGPIRRTPPATTASARSGWGSGRGLRGYLD